ncbi:MAG: glycosyltransferase family 90 protein [Paraprevotella sp.]|nr:glycosyltransferase family 90 protein [Paraprevotella sp.]
MIYKLKSGKPNKFLNFHSGFAGLAIPNALFRRRLPELLTQAVRRPDYDYIRQRVNYYIKTRQPFRVSGEDRLTRERSWIYYTGRIGDYTRKMFHTAYYFDQHEVTRWFPADLRWNFCPGDVYFTSDTPTVVKSRLLAGDNSNFVILKLDKLRHFMFVHDPLSFRQKKDKAIFRGKIRQSRVRTKFLEMFFNHPMFDCGVVGKNEGCPDEWMSEKKTIREHLDYKFILALEGNDVASNLKWVMSSNSLAVMTRPTCETWFMEGQLKADFHYVEVKEDFSDLPEKLQFYIDHPDKAEEILRHAHEYVAQFQDKKREELITLMVMDQYFRLSGQR